MNIPPLDDRQYQVVLTALLHLKTTKQIEVGAKTYTKLNEYDLLSAQHTLMHSIKLLSLLTAKPLQHFMNPLQSTGGVSKEEGVDNLKKPKP